MTARLRAPSLYLAAAMGAVVLGLAAVVAPSIAGAAALMVLGAVALAVLVLRLTDPEDRRRIGRWTAWSFLGHLGLGVVISSSAGLRSYFGGDADQYHEGAQAIVAHWLQGSNMPMLPAGKEGFYYLLAGLYWAVGQSWLIGLVVNAVMTAALVPLMSTLTSELFGRRAARTVPVLVTLLPGFIIWGSQLLREAGVYFFTAVALLAVTRLTRRIQLSSIVMMAVALALLGTWRSYIALMVAAGLILAMVLASRGLAGIGAGLSGLVVVTALVVGLGVGYSGLQATRESDLEEVNFIRSYSATGAESGYLEDADVSDSRRAIGYLPSGISYLALGPFPWQLASGRQLFGAPDAIAWWVLLPSLVTGIRVGWRRRGRLIIVLIGPAIGAAIAIALLIANFGTMVRARMQVILILLPLIALGWSERHPRRFRESEEIENRATESLV